MCSSLEDRTRLLPEQYDAVLLQPRPRPESVESWTGPRLGRVEVETVGSTFTWKHPQKKNSPPP